MRRVAVKDRFWSKVDVGAPDECWPWTAHVRSDGYGQIEVNGRADYAHRMALILSTGELIPDGLVVDHLCENKACVNPTHLEAVSQLENVQRSRW